MDSCPATRFVLYFIIVIVILTSMVMTFNAGHLGYVTGQKLDKDMPYSAIDTRHSTLRDLYKHILVVGIFVPYAF